MLRGRPALNPSQACPSRLSVGPVVHFQCPRSEARDLNQCVTCCDSESGTIWQILLNLKG